MSDTAQCFLKGIQQVGSYTEVPSDVTCFGLHRGHFPVMADCAGATWGHNEISGWWTDPLLGENRVILLQMTDTLVTSGFLSPVQDLRQHHQNEKTILQELQEKKERKASLRF